MPSAHFPSGLNSIQTRFVKAVLAELPIEERGAVFESVAARLPSSGRINAQLVGAVRAVLDRHRVAAGYFIAPGWLRLQAPARFP
jgi:hypothetical protein